MKKLALLLAALSVASVSYAKEVMPVAEPVVEEEVVVEAPVVEVKAAPVLRVTSVGQYLEIDNTSNGTKADGSYMGENVGEGIHLGNKVGLALGDNWTFDLMARKTWRASTDRTPATKDEPNGFKGMESNGHRLDLEATRHFENFTVGAKWRGEKNLDKFYLPVSYNFGMISGWATPAYTFYDDGQDAFYLEAEPVVLSYGPVQLAYYFEGEKFTGDGDYKEDYDSFHDHWYNHQVRLRGTLYSNDVLTLGVEYRYQFESEDVYKDKATGEEFKLENNRHIAILSAAYNVTENLVIDTYYEYDFNKYDTHTNVSVDDDYYGEFGLGWTYNF